MILSTPPPSPPFLSFFLCSCSCCWCTYTQVQKRRSASANISLYIYIKGHVIYLIARERERERGIRPLYHTPSFCIYKPPKSPKLFPFYLPICLFVYLLICLFAYLVVGNWWANTSKIKDCCPPLM